MNCIETAQNEVTASDNQGNSGIKIILSELAILVLTSFTIDSQPMSFSIVF